MAKLISLTFLGSHLGCSSWFITELLPHDEHKVSFNFVGLCQGKQCLAHPIEHKLMATMIGQISIVQEGRFWLNDNNGVAHHFTLAYHAHVPEPGLQNMQREGKNILVTYTAARNTLTGIVHRIRVL